MRPMTVAFVLCALACALAACGADNELVPVDDGLLEPPGTTQKPSGSSTSSSGTTPAPPSSGTSSSSSSSSSGGDIPPAPEADCDPYANYTDYTPVLGLPADASWLRLTGDELNAFYVQPGAGGTARIWRTQRASRDAAFEPGNELGTGVNLASVVSEPLPSDDGLTLHYSANNNVYVATRASIEQPFQPATLAIEDAKSLVVARDGGLVVYARRKRFPSAPYPYRWLAFGQPIGAGEKLFAVADPGVDLFPTWYEPLSRQAWIARGEETVIYTWDGEWHAAAATDFRVSWTSPNGCRLYGRHNGTLMMRSRVPSPPAADAGAGGAGQ